MAIQMGCTIYDLEEAELSNMPPFESAKDPINFAGRQLPMSFTAICRSAIGPAAQHAAFYRMGSKSGIIPAECFPVRKI
jgi:hypothetical protein